MCDDDPCTNATSKDGCDYYSRPNNVLAASETAWDVVFSRGERE